MNTRLLLVVCTGLYFAGAPCVADDASPAGYKLSLFDGKSLDGWVVENGCKAVVDDGTLLLQAGDGWLRSQHAYADFTLHLQWKALKESDYDAGIFFRASAEGRPFPQQNYQVNLLDGKEGQVPRIPAAVVKNLVKRGEWNTFVITVIGDTISLKVNGHAAYTASGLKLARGYVGLQCEVPKGGQFRFRDIWIVEHGYQSLFNGKNLAGWTGAGQPAEKCWEVVDGVLIGTKNKGPWLRSDKQYGDFNFRLEYRTDAGANSGVYVRVPENGNHHRDNAELPPAGFEVQILDDSAAKYRNLKPYQFSASVYDIAGATPRVTRPPGEWNTLEINCVGQSITNWHNGKPVISVTPKSHPEIALRQLKGYLGLQNHGGGVGFRHLRVGPGVRP